MITLDLDPSAQQLLDAIGRARDERDPDMFGATGHSPNIITEAVALGLDALARREGLDSEAMVGRTRAAARLADAITKDRHVQTPHPTGPLGHRPLVMAEAVTLGLLEVANELDNSPQLANLRRAVMLDADPVGCSAAIQLAELIARSRYPYPLPLDGIGHLGQLPNIMAEATLLGLLEVSTDVAEDTAELVQLRELVQQEYEARRTRIAEPPRKGPAPTARR